MRTTITIDDRLLEELKRRAAEQGTSVSGLIEDSVRLATAPAPRQLEPEPPFELVTFGRGGRFTSRNIDRISALVEEEDLERHGRHG